MLFAPFSHEAALHIGKNVRVIRKYLAFLYLIYVCKDLVKGGRLGVLFADSVIAEAYSYHAAVFAAVVEGLTPRVEKCFVKIIVLTGNVIPVGVGSTIDSRGEGSDVDKEQDETSCWAVYRSFPGFADRPYSGSIACAGVLYGLNGFGVADTAVCKSVVSACSGYLRQSGDDKSGRQQR